MRRLVEPRSRQKRQRSARLLWVSLLRREVELNELASTPSAPINIPAVSLELELLQPLSAEGHPSINFALSSRTYILNYMSRMVLIPDSRY